MKNIILLISLVTLISCSSPSEPEPIRKVVAPETLVVEGSGCGDVVRLNDAIVGQTITITAKLGGCSANVALLAETRNANGAAISRFRMPSNCDVTETTITFAKTGEKIYLGLFPCGSAAMSGVAYKLVITQNGVSKTIDGKVGNTVKYITL